MGDETGSIRLVIWDEKLIDLLKEIKPNDVIKITNSYSDSATPLNLHSKILSIILFF
jgi:ssDNA-binding replication factor A large subunit